MKGFIKNIRGSTLLQNIIGVAIAIIVIAALIPTAMETFFAVNTTNWSTSTAALWVIIPVMVIVALVIGVIAYVKYRD